MIPTLIVGGLVLGRWWRTALAAGVVFWVMWLLASSTLELAAVPGAAGLALVNTGVGVLAHQAALQTLRRIRDGGHRETA